MHKAVLYKEVLEQMNPASGERYLDATVGSGGHASGILETSSPDGFLLGLDRDPLAITEADRRLIEFNNRYILVHASYDKMLEVADRLNLDDFGGVLMDLGLSSMQLENGDRGFSFRLNGPLDMRYDNSSGATAEELINSLSESEIADLIWRYGEEPKSRRYARAIVQVRPIRSTTQLADIISSVSDSRGKIHPATRVFQAFRIAVNDELGTLQRGLTAAVELLKKGGRLSVISFHSLEDRIVKEFIRQLSRDCVCPPEYPVCMCDAKPILRPTHRKVITPAAEEVRNNPRSRSAKLRVAEKVG